MALFKRKFKRDHPFTVKEGDIKLGKLDRGSAEDWLEQDSTARETVGKNFDINKTFKVELFFLLFLGIIMARAAWLQIIKGSYYYELAEGNRIRVERVESKRGVIYDRNYKTLVRNSANFLLYFIPSDLPKDNLARQAIIKRVSDILINLKPEDIEDLLAVVEPGSLESYQPFL